MTVPFGTKSEYLADCVFDLDDYYYQHDRNALNYLFYLKALYPLMKVTLFTVPDHPDSPWEKMKEWLKMFYVLDWIEIAMHGWHHETPIECKEWTREQAETAIAKWDVLVNGGYVQAGFKAPGWQISDATYEVLNKKGYWVADHTYNEDRRPKDLLSYTLAHPWVFHGHTWDIPNDNPVYRNGVRQIIEEHGLPWDQSTRFHFVSQVVR